MAVIMKAKTALIQESSFLKPPTIIFKPLVILFGLAQTKIIKEVVA